MTTSYARRRIAIIGGGFAGAVTVIKLIDTVREPLDLAIVEPAPEIGRGIAFGTPHHHFLVNGLAKAFSLFPEDPEHLARWLHAHRDGWAWRPPAGRAWADSSPPRAIYGDYVASELAAALRRGGGRVALSHVRDRAVALHEHGDGVRAHLASGTEIHADEVVLATGLFPKALRVEGGRASGPSGYIADPWKSGAFDGAARAGRVLLLGTSLTMLDAIIALEKAGFRGRYDAVSSRGLVLQPRRDAPAWRDFLGEAPLPRTALDLLRAVQRERRAIRGAGEDWQRLTLSIRPYLVALWAGAGTAERKRFIRHLRAFWDLTLHRAPPASYAELERVGRDGRFRAIAGTVERLDAEEAAVSVLLRPRGSVQGTRERYDIVVNALGHQFDWHRIDDPLVRQLLRDGLVRPHDTGFGIDADAATRGVVGAAGLASARIFAVGHPLRGVFWESSSITEQVAGAIELARSLARDGRERREVA